MILSSHRFEIFDKELASEVFEMLKPDIWKSYTLTDWESMQTIYCLDYWVADNTNHFKCVEKMKRLDNSVKSKINCIY